MSFFIHEIHEIHEIHKTIITFNVSYYVFY
jgi:hypothetical protein